MPITSISVVIVARENLHLTKKTIASVFQQDIPVEILVINNACTDGTAQWLATKHLTVIHTTEQWALAKCWNVALKALWKAGWDRALVLNNDIVLRPDAARLLSEHGGEFVTCVSVNSEEQLGEAGDRDIKSLRKTEREHPDFSCFLIRKSVTDRNLWFNEDLYPAFFEDNFFHVECHRAGVRCLCVDLPFLHFGSATIKNANEGDRERIKRFADINKRKFRATFGCVPGTKEYERLFF